MSKKSTPITPITADSATSALFDPAANAPASFEAAMADLAQLVAQMEEGQLPLEASVAAYRRGAELVKYCAAQLDKVEAQVKVLESDMLQPFAEAGANEAQQ
jgi:exodeoxyribonuclease VII small subunit